MILTALALALQAPLPPLMPPGLNSHFMHAAYAVEQDVGAGKFELAKAECARLPNRTIRFRWDDSGVPEASRSQFRAAAQQAMAVWQRAVPALRFSESTRADIEFSFCGPIPRAGGSTLPPGALIDFSDSSVQMKEAIALKRLDPPQDIYPADVFNEVAFAIGQYLGVEETPEFGSVTSRTNQNTTDRVRTNPLATSIAEAALDSADSLRELVDRKQQIRVATPALGLSTVAISGVKGYQDEPLEFTFEVSNKGSSDLQLFVLPDCGCLDPQSPGLIKPNGVGVVHTAIDTVDFYGHLNHDLLVYSNDPNWSIVRIPVSMDIVPLYRFYRPGPPVVQMTQHGADFDGYLLLSSHANFTVLTASILGTPGKVAFYPWSGTLPDDPESKGSPVSGYKFHVEISPISTPGMVPVTLLLGTSSIDLREINESINVQQGIVAIPSQVYFGQLSSEQKSMHFLVSGPGKAFKIIRIDTGSPYLRATFSAEKDADEYDVELTYTGKGSFGPLVSTVKVYVDDSRQRVVPVPVQAVIQ